MLRFDRFARRMHAPVLLIETGSPVAPLRRHGSFAHWIRIAAGLPRDRAVVCRVHEGDALPRAEGFVGVIVSGSAAMVTERLPWSEATAAWLRRAGESGLPLLGICYGHQLIAHAFGGEVGDNPRGREMGTIRVDVHDAAAGDPLFGAAAPAFLAQATHRQTVLRAPADATVLAASSLDVCQAFRIGDAIWGMQYHPEFSAFVMRGYIRARADALRCEERDVQAMLAAVRAAPRARATLRRFVRLLDAG